jgi:hypothetical protein
MNQQLMIAVERAVRPVQAPNSRKLRMRQELLAHLEDIHAEEADRGGDEETILRRSLARFGDAEALTAELQQSVPKAELYEGWLNRWFSRRPGESPGRIAARVTTVSLLMVLAELAVVGLAQFIRGQGYWIDPVGVTVVLLMMLIDVFVLTWLAALSGEMANSIGGAAWRQPRLWLAAVAGGIVIGGGGLLVMLAVSRGEAPSAAAARTWGLLAVAAVIGFVGALQAAQYDCRRVAEWESLDLGDVA